MPFFPKAKRAARAIRLPMVEEPPQVYRCQDWPSRCSECPLFGNPCPGCGDYLKTCIQADSGGDCNRCLGAAEKTDYVVPSVCCKSPLRDFAVSVIQEWWAAPVPHRVSLWEHGDVSVIISPKWAKRLGVRTRAYGILLPHLPSYLCTRDLTKFGEVGAPEDAPVVCIGVGVDPLLLQKGEMLAPEHMRALGVTHWTPMVWGVYRNGAHMDQLFNLARIRRSLIVSQAHFVPFYAPVGLGKTLLLWYVEQLESVPNLFVDLSQGGTRPGPIKDVARALAPLYRMRPSPTAVLVHGVLERFQPAFAAAFPKWTWVFTHVLGAPRDKKKVASAVAA